MKNKKEVLFGLYNDETELLSAVQSANEDHLNIMDVLTPFPIHGLDPLLGLKESRLHIVGFVFGAIGTTCAFLFMTWVFVSDWPMIFGGKPYFAAPSFIPVTFEFTVLMAAIGMTVTFYTICGMGPGIVNPILDSRITDNKFCLAFDLTHKQEEEEKLRSFFNKTGASEVHSKNI